VTAPFVHRAPNLSGIHNTPLPRTRSERQGPNLENAVLVGLISIAVAGVMTLLGDALGGLFGKTSGRTSTNNTLPGCPHEEFYLTDIDNPNGCYLP
jgi:Flp pilus assembly pilin Flp